MEDRKTSRTTVNFFLLVLLILSSYSISRGKTISGKRQVISLNGTWEVAEGAMEPVPGAFNHKAPVPGLIDMAKPSFAEVGKRSDKRQAFWYRRTFTIDEPVPAVAILKIHKAKYGTKIFLNGKVVGEHLPCFTPSLLDVKKYLKDSGSQNELIIRVGADRESLPEGMPTGWDFEKYLYIPGIYDSVELILTGSVYISNVQTIGDIIDKAVRIKAEINNINPEDETRIQCIVRELKTGKVVGRSEKTVKLSKDSEGKFVYSESIPISKCRFWSPEEPFLYELEMNTADDAVRVRFGMRTFGFDRESGRALLNGKPYFMRGTNVCVYRFFEDEERGDRPWRKEWIRRLHRKFKSMNWNSIRYCIGFPPEIWYEIADEEGFLIQDEFPIWLLSDAPEKPQAEKIIPEYIEWMRERWNHACVVIWDAQNESDTEETGKALRAVRYLDMSNRPWDNGWAAPVSMEDCLESHPYLFIRAWQGNEEPFRMKEMAQLSGTPALRDVQKKYNLPIILNEYAWLWLTRDGMPTSLTGKVYESLLGANSTIEQRRKLNAKYLAALTEFWRCHRKCAGVLHFCGLGYSRPGDKPRPEGGATSDHFIDMEKLVFEPYFERYLRDAFSPVGVMIDAWEPEFAPSTKQNISIFVINDLYQDWKGKVNLRIVQKNRVVFEQFQRCIVKSLGREILTFEQEIPAITGDYQIVAELAADGAKKVVSVRDLRVVESDK